jgi:stage II sporulation protein AA (anti-sigma F factor antagonist)
VPSESQALSVSVVQHGSRYAVVAIGGELDTDTATLLHHQLAAQVTQGRTNLVLDLAEVPFMDSSGLNIVLRAMNETRQLEGRLLLAAPTSAVRRLLDLTGISLTRKPFDTVEEALASLPIGTVEAV